MNSSVAQAAFTFILNSSSDSDGFEIISRDSPKIVITDHDDELTTTGIQHLADVEQALQVDKCTRPLIEHLEDIAAEPEVEQVKKRCRRITLQEVFNSVFEHFEPDLPCVEIKVTKGSANDDANDLEKQNDELKEKIAELEVKLDKQSKLTSKQENIPSDCLMCNGREDILSRMIELEVELNEYRQTYKFLQSTNIIDLMTNFKNADFDLKAMVDVNRKMTNKVEEIWEEKMEVEATCQSLREQLNMSKVTVENLTLENKKLTEKFQDFQSAVKQLFK